MEKNKETGHWRDIYQNERDIACSEHDMTYGYFKDLTRRTTSDNMLCDKALNIARNPKYAEYQRGLVSMVSKIFDKISTWFTDKSAFGSGIKNEIISNKELPEELQKPIIRNFNKRKYTRQYLGCWSCWYAINKQI